jgi:two-component system sensor histidine kinase UhpB
VPRTLAKSGTGGVGTILETLFLYAPIGIAITDRSTRFVRSNARLQRMLGYTGSEMRTLHAVDVTFPPDLPKIMALRARVFDGGLTDFVLDKRCVCKDRSLLWCRNNVAAVPNPGLLPRYVLELVEDISEIKAAEASLRATSAQLRALTRRLVNLQEDERRGLAAELHDQIGQALAIIGIKLTVAESQLAPGQNACVTALHDAEAMLEEAGRAARNVISQLRPAVLDDYGLVAALRWLAEQASRRHGFAVQFDAPEDMQRLPPEVEATFFRIAQEALSNVARHAQADAVHIVLKRRGEGAVMFMRDNGRGFDCAELKAPEKRSTWGLLMMRERAEAAGVRLRIRSAPGKGTRLLLRWPPQG